MEAGIEGRRSLDLVLGGETAVHGVCLLAGWYPDKPEQSVRLAYRFGEGLSVYRVVFGAPF